MRYWITQEGMYYEAEVKIQPSDMEVSKRPAKNCNFINGNWICPSLEQPMHDEFHHDPDGVRVHRVRLQTNPSYAHPPYEPLTLSTRQHDVSHEQPKNDDVTLNTNTKLMFGVRELLMVGAFIVTATISWQDTNSRIVKLEDNRSIEMVDARVKLLEGELKAMDKQNRVDNQKLEQTIRELEQVIFMRNSKK